MTFIGPRSDDYGILHNSHAARVAKARAVTARISAAQPLRAKAAQLLRDQADRLYDLIDADHDARHLVASVMRREATKLDRKAAS